MVFTGVDIDPDSGDVRKWRVENSWGKGKRGDKSHDGFISMSNSWFREYVYQVVISVDALDPNLVEYVQTTKHITPLPNWDVFGTVA
jgi:bleomycin hydrolase